MAIKTEITSVEKEQLRKYAKDSPLVLVRLKATAVLMWDNGMSDRGERRVDINSGQLTERNWLKNLHVFSGYSIKLRKIATRKF